MSRQGDLFASRPEALAPAPSLEPEALRREARRRLRLTLDALAGSTKGKLPRGWEPDRAPMMARVHHTMASWLPEEERDAARAELRAHCERLGVEMPVAG
jgi:hypothetical protein